MKDRLYNKWFPVLSLLENIKITDELLNYCEKYYTNNHIIHTFFIINKICKNYKIHYSINYKKDLRKFKTKSILYNINYYTSKNIKVKLNNDTIDDLNAINLNATDYIINLIRKEIINNIFKLNYENILIGNIIKNIYRDKEHNELLIETEYILY